MSGVSRSLAKYARLDGAAFTAQPTGPGLPRCMVQFNGVSLAIARSYNLAGITDLGVGWYRANFTTNAPDANHVLSGSFCYVDDAHSVAVANVATPFAVNYAEFYTLQDSGAGSGGVVVDGTFVSVLVM